MIPYTGSILIANINENGVKCRITAMETTKAYAVQTIANIDIQRMSVLEIEKNSTVNLPCINMITLMQIAPAPSW